jgi:hypothetical protein
MAVVMPRAQTRRFGPAAWLALLAVLFQALLPAVHHPAGMAMAGGLGIGGGGGINLCLAPGTPPGNSAPADPGKNPAPHAPACPLCQAIHAIGGFAPPTAPSLPVRHGEAIILPASVAAWVEPYAYRTHPQPRAPPLA